MIQITTYIEEYLTIAGIAQRRIIELRSAAAASKDSYPSGPDDWELTQESATCEAIIANAKAMLSFHMLQLHFTTDGRATARAPKALRGSEHDMGLHRELLQ